MIMTLEHNRISVVEIDLTLKGITTLDVSFQLYLHSVVEIDLTLKGITTFMFHGCSPTSLLCRN